MTQHVTFFRPFLQESNPTAFCNSLKHVSKKIAALARLVVSAVVSFFQNLFNQLFPCKSLHQRVEKPIRNEAPLPFRERVALPVEQAVVQEPVKPIMRTRYQIHQAICTIEAGVLATQHVDAIVICPDKKISGVDSPMILYRSRESFEIDRLPPNVTESVRGIVEVSLREVNHEDFMREQIEKQVTKILAFLMEKESVETVAFSPIGLIRENCSFGIVIEEMFTAIQNFALDNPNRFRAIKIIVEAPLFEEASEIAKQRIVNSPNVRKI